MEQKELIRNFINGHLIVFEEENPFSDDDDIFKLGFVNSLFAMKLVAFIESEFQLTLEDEDFDIQNFSSVNAILQLIARKRV